MSRSRISMGKYVTSEQLEEERAQISGYSFVKSDEDCGWLMRTWRDLQLAFRMPKSPLPVEMKGFAKRSLKRALKQTSCKDLPIILDGEEYRLVKKTKYDRKFRP